MLANLKMHQRVCMNEIEKASNENSDHACMEAGHHDQIKGPREMDERSFFRRELSFALSATHKRIIRGEKIH